MTARNNVPGEPIAGTPRSVQEMSFVAGARACARCGDRSELHWEHGGAGEVWRTQATCPSCGNERVYVFVGPDDLYDAEPPELELGEGVSSVLDPHDLVAEIDRIEPAIATPLSPLDGHSEQNWDRVERVQTALNELAKFVAPGTTAIPATAMRDEAGLRDYNARPERYSKAWVDRAIARYRQLVANVSPPPSTRPAPAVPERGTIDRAALTAHREWYYTGKGARLDVSGLRAAGARLDGSEVIGARVQHVDFSNANFDQAEWSKSELTACRLDNARLNRAKLAESVILDCTFDGSAGAMLDLSKTKVSSCSFARAGLVGCYWMDATVSATTFAGASFGNARWDRARFVDCDFTEASFEPDREAPPMRMRGAVFEGCDLRGANFTGVDFRGVTFKRCKLGGAHGEPKYKTELTVLDCDLAQDELLKRLVLPTLSADDLRAHPSYVVARDHDDGSDPEHVVFDLGDSGARRVAQTAAPASASTRGRNGIIWMSTAQTFTVWSRDQRKFVATRSEIRTPGGVTPNSAVTRVVSFIDPADPSRRGVAIVTPSGRVPRLVVVQELDMIARDDKAYSFDDARRDGRWAAQLGKELAEFLAVPYDELRTDFT